MVTVEEIKAAMAAERADVKARIVAALRQDGTATTTALRGMFERYDAHRHRHPVFWNRLAELERLGVIVRAGRKAVQPWEFPETIWALPAGGESV